MFFVPRLGVFGSPMQHGTNYNFLVSKYREAVAELSRKRRPLETYDRTRLERLATAAHDYSCYFDIPRDSYVELFPETDFLNLRTAESERAARAANPATAARRERERAKREAAKAEAARLAALKGAEKLAAWQVGANVSVYGLPPGRDNSAYLRVVGETVETSFGARVPLAEAIRVFRLVKACHDAGREWHSDRDSRVVVGSYSVTKIRATGDFIAGCHFLAWEEVERLARSIGVFEESTDA